MYRIKIDRDRCIGCLTCVTACVVSHETESGDARNRVVIDSETTPAPIFCRHCDRPECTYTCMTGAMRKNPETGFVEYDKNHCASCYMQPCFSDSGCSLPRSPVGRGFVPESDQAQRVL